MMDDDTGFSYPIGMGMIGVLRESDEPMRPRPPMGFGVVTVPTAADATEPELWAIMRGDA